MHRICLGVFSILCVALTGCVSPSLVLDQRFVEAAEYIPVTGRQGFMLRQQISFGPYHTGVIDRDWDSTSSLTVGGFESHRQKSGFRYSFQKLNNPVAQIDCASGRDADLVRFKGVLGGDVSWYQAAESYFNCSAVEWGETQNWTLELFQRDDISEMRGFFYSAADDLPAFEVRSTRHLTDIPLSTDIVGYFIYLDGIQLAAVQTMNEGGVWLTAGLSESTQRRVMSLVSALLAFRPAESE